MSPEESFIGILACAVAADRRHRAPELELIELIVDHHRYTKSLGEAVHREIVDRVCSNVSEQGSISVIDVYCASLPVEWQGAAFLSALDLIFVDGESDTGEIDFIGTLAKKFEIENSTAEYVTAVFKEKNAVK